MYAMAGIDLEKTAQQVSVKFTIIIAHQSIQLILLCLFCGMYIALFKDTINIGVMHGYGSVHSRNLSAGLFAAIISVIYAWRRADNN